MAYTLCAKGFVQPSIVFILWKYWNSQIILFMYIYHEPRLGMVAHYII